MARQPNKPGGDFSDGDEPRDVEDEAAVRNQSEVTPEDYPEAAGGDDLEGRDR